MDQGVQGSLGSDRPDMSQGYIYGAHLIFSKLMGPLIGNQIPEEKVERNRKNMFESLQRLEEKFFGDGTFLTGYQVTVADLMCLEELMQVGDQ